MRNLPLIVIVLVIGFGIGYFLNGSNEQAVEQEASMEEATTSTLAAVKEKGYVQCGVSQGLPGFSNADDNGNWTGIDVDLCRGVAAAVFGDADKVRFTPLSAKQRFTALSSGEIDIL